MKLKYPKHAAHTLRALGRDPLTADYEFDGDELKIKGVSDDEIAAAEATVDVAAIEAEEKLEEVRAKRAAEYPDIGSQLDAVLKQINYMRLNGQDMIQEMDDVLNEWLAVKAKYPKE